MIRQFLHDNKILAAAPTANLGQAATDLVGSVIDTRGYTSITFITRFGTVTATAVVALKFEGSDAAALSDAEEYDGAGVTVAATDDDTIFAVELYQPKHRYVRLTVERATANADVDDMLAILATASKTPVTQTIETSINIAEGF